MNKKNCLYQENEVHMMTVNKYKKMKNWKETYPNNKVVLQFAKSIDSSWNVFMKSIIENSDIVTIEQQLSEEMKKKQEKEMFPYPELVFCAFKYTNYNNLSVVFLGQDPYPQINNDVPYATGLAFSISHGQTIPSSLKNIFLNLYRFKHINKIPAHGNLEFYAYQGCLFLNTALTLTEGEKNGHTDIWKSFTDLIISELSVKKTNLVFVLWGAYALKKITMIDTNKHKVIISSHPSGLSCDKQLNNYPAFSQNDHFGQINEYIVQHGKKPIIW